MKKVFMLALVAFMTLAVSQKAQAIEDPNPKGTLVIGVLTQNNLLEKTVSNMAECKARGAYLMGLTSYGNYSVEDSVNFTIYVPKADPHFIGSLAVIPLQLLGYYLSVAKGLDVDKPRNLAKSVTVE